MAVRNKRTRRFRIVVTPPRQSETRLDDRAEKMQKIAAVFGHTTGEEVVDAAVDFLALAAAIAEVHGTEKVVIGTTEKLFTAFADEEA